MNDAPSQSQDKFIVRLPDGMRDSLKRLAEANKRSMNAEIVAALEAHLKRPKFFVFDQGPEPDPSLIPDPLDPADVPSPDLSLEAYSLMEQLFQQIREDTEKKINAALATRGKVE